MNQNSTKPGTAEGAGRPAEWKGTLSVDGRWHIELDSMEPCFEIGEAEGTCKVAIVAKSFPNAEGNARRLAAAWNAVAGIPTEALETGAVADLLEACEAALPHVPGVAKHVREMLIDAIAKAQGRTQP